MVLRLLMVVLRDYGVPGIKPRPHQQAYMSLLSHSPQPWVYSDLKIKTGKLTTAINFLCEIHIIFFLEKCKASFPFYIMFAQMGSGKVSG